MNEMKKGLLNNFKNVGCLVMLHKENYHGGSLIVNGFNYSSFGHYFNYKNYHIYKYLTFLFNWLLIENNPFITISLKKILNTL